MTQTKRVPWQDLLSKQFSNISDQYGPNSQAVASAMLVLRDISWFEHVGQPWLESTQGPLDPVHIVKSWDEALKIFDDVPRYNANGVLQAACDPCDAIFANDTVRQAWWERARRDAKEYTILMGWIPDSLAEEHQELLHENMWEFISMLLSEIIAAPDANCTYFREQLSWFHVGHFPCGWDGAWPSGRMRVF